MRIHMHLSPTIIQQNIDMGALVDKSQYDSIKGFCDRATAEGATVYKANVDVPEGGWYWPPTMISNVYPVSECVREEIFGPVLSVLTFRSPEEAIKLANNSKFGLAGSVWTENVSLALEVAVSLKAGAVWVNAHNLFDAAAGFGGFRESGFGRDGGKEGEWRASVFSHLCVCVFVCVCVSVCLCASESRASHATVERRVSGAQDLFVLFCFSFCLCFVDDDDNNILFGLESMTPMFNKCTTPTDSSARSHLHASDTRLVRAGEQHTLVLACIVACIVLACIVLAVCTSW
jgi:hypothetical protein